jgi:prepilin-type processing-associated H-X9-DG protein
MNLKNLALVVASLAVSLLAAEVLYRYVLDDGMTYEVEMWKYAKHVKMRSADPNIGHQHQPNAQAKLMGVDVRTDANGFRSPSIPAEAPAGVARISFVGDSITMGWGVAENETFSLRILNQLRSAGRKVDGFNAGVGNLNTAQEVSLFEAAGAKLKPDVVVLAYFINDAEPAPMYGDVSWLDWNSELWVVLKYQVDSLLRRAGERKSWKDYYRDLYRSGQPGWVKTQQELGRLVRIAKDIGAQPIVFNVPELRELKPYPFNDVTAQVRGVVEASGAPFVDLLPSVEAETPSALWVTVPDPHPNGKANALFADMMSKALLPYLDKLCASQGKGCAAN